MYSQNTLLQYYVLQSKIIQSLSSDAHLPPKYTFGYVGSIWGKWASDDRYFYIEDADGRKVTSGWDCNHMQECWEKLCVHIVTKVICYGRDGWGVHP